MANMMDYLAWRGDIAFTAAPFNEVDNLILSTIAYIDFDGILQADGSGEMLPAAAKAYFARHSNEKKIDMGLLLNDKIPQLLQAAAESRRFADVRIFAYVNRIDIAQQKQFCAMCFLLPGNFCYVAYRGTDDTIVGWQENFNMSFSTAVPAQLSAVEYLRGIAAATACALVSGGHSKGGNLAVYAAMHVPAAVQQRIAAVYNNDGPGFADNVLGQPEYLAVRSKIHTIVPQSSTVGMLLEHEEEFETVKSTQVGPFQHDSCSWEVLGAAFVPVDKLAASSRRFDAAMKAWLAGMNENQRAQFVKTVFTVLTASGAKTLRDLSRNKLKTADAIAKTLKNMEGTEKEMMFKAIELLMKEDLRAHLQR